MTREEAIEKLEIMRQKVDEETYRALILAIKALEQEPTDEKSVQDMTELEKALLHIKTRADAWAVKVVKDALEPCTYAVSRDAILEWCGDINMDVYTDEVKEFVNGLPSVTQKSDNKYRKEAKRWKNKWLKSQKSGKWIEKDGFDGDVYYDCSVCGESWTTIEGTPWDNEWNYCPNCGAKMESEDKE